jgi:DNA-binding transcriptional regulator WhiA
MASLPKTNTAWSKEDIKDLYNNYNYYLKNKEYAISIFGRNWKAISARSNLIGCSRNHWTNDECELLYDNYNYYLNNKEEAIKDLRRTWKAICIKARDMGCKSENILKSNPHIFNNLKDYIYGLLISDGSIPYNIQCNTTSQYQQSCRYSEWIKMIGDVFKSNNINYNISKILPKKGFKSCNEQTFISTACYTEFKLLRNIWYPDEIKVVPDDFKLSPICVNNWFLGDGNCSKNGNGYMIQLATNGFIKDDVIFLCDILNNKLDLKAHTNKAGTIQITNYSGVSKFLNYINSCDIPECYSYKFPEGAM